MGCGYLCQGRGCVSSNHACTSVRIQRPSRITTVWPDYWALESGLGKALARVITNSPPETEAGVGREGEAGGRAARTHGKGELQQTALQRRLSAMHACWTGTPSRRAGRSPRSSGSTGLRAWAWWHPGSRAGAGGSWGRLGRRSRRAWRSRGASCRWRARQRSRSRSAWSGWSGR